MMIYRRIFLFFPALILIFIIMCLIIYTNHNKNPESNNYASNHMPTIINYSSLSADFNSSNLDYIVITETPIPTRTPTSTRTPTPTIKFITSSQFEEWFDKYSSNQSVNKDLLKKIAVCESDLNPQAVNGFYAGLYQFSESSWRNTRKQMNQDDNLKLRFDPEEAIETAAFRLATSGPAAWPNCSK